MAAIEEQLTVDEVIDVREGPSPDLRILERRIYRGPNIWSYRRAIRLLVDLGSLEAWPSDRLPGFTDALVELLPGLRDHACSRGHAGGFVERLEEGTWLGHVAEHVALALQARSGADTRRGKTRGAGQAGRYHVVFDYEDERVGLEAAALAVRIVNHLVRAEPDFDPDLAIDDLLRYATRVGFGPSTRALLDEAESRRIPWIRLDPNSSLVQLGWGVHQRRIQATVTSATSAIAVDIAKDKSLTARLLRDAGMPVPASEVVRTESGAVDAAAEIGHPVVVKPLDGNHGRGVTIDLSDEADIRSAFGVAAAASRGGRVLVERLVDGFDHRLLVVNGRLVAASRRMPASVVGDGCSTVAELVERVNLDPRRGIGHEGTLTRIELDETTEAVLARQGLTVDAVPSDGDVVLLARTANLSTGGIAIDVTDSVHPDNAELAREAALVVGLDVAGIDIVAPCLDAPIVEAGGAIVEVNAGPGFRMHTAPSHGDAQYVARAVMDELFPPGMPSRIPVVAVTGTNGKTTVTRMIAHLLRSLGHTVGLTSTDGIYVNDRMILKADASGPKSARTVLRHPAVEAAVLEVARGGILREGLGYDRNDVAVVLNVQADHLGLAGIETIEQLADVKQVIVEAVPRDGVAVLNADDPLVVGMARACLGDVTWFSEGPTNEVVVDHCERGGRAVVLDDVEGVETIVLRDGRRWLPIVDVRSLPSTFGGAARMNVLNAMAAAGAALACGAHLADVRRGLRTFSTSFELAPGRLNIRDVRGVTVVVDYGHNPAAMRAMGEFVERYSQQLESSRRPVPRRIGVIGTAGDRRDEDLCNLGAIAATYFDHIVVREDGSLRGRAPGETALHIRGGVEAAIRAGARCRSVETVLDEVASVQSALAVTKPGDLVVAFVESTAAVWDAISE